MNIYLGVDTGGTFTDFVLIQNNKYSTHKVLSTPNAPEQAILTGLSELGLMPIATNIALFIVHGSTVATNAVLEKKGVQTVFITNKGFKDMLSLGRQARSELYNLQPEQMHQALNSEYCLEISGRLSAQGEVIESPEETELNGLINQIKQLNPAAVAINCLFSYLDDQFEKQIEAAIKNALPNIFISRSSQILPEYKEYERGMTTWLNAYVGPLVKGYLARLQKAIPSANLSVMQSAGNTIAAEHAGDQAVHMLLSGPAGGLAAAQYLGELTKQPRLLTFDMGGTSTDVALVEENIQLTNESVIAGYPVAIPMIDMHTIGAGGGSIAYVDEGGLLQVGPESAGANPGPACYGQGGERPTVTDANLILGRLLPEAFLGGGLILDRQAAHQAIVPLATQLQLSVEETATGIINIANEHMSNALRVMSVQRGIDARELSLCSFGGAGGLHVCALADALQIKKAIVPIHAGVLSALGMLVAPKGREYSRTINCLLDSSEKVKARMTHEFARLIDQGRQALIAESVDEKDIVVETSLDCRYQGQSYTLNVAYNTDDDSEDKSGVVRAQTLFIQQHQQRYGHALELPIELVNVRVSLKAEQPFKTTLEAVSVQSNANESEMIQSNKNIMIYHRDDLRPGQTIHGPLLITETTATTFIDAGWQAIKDNYGNILLNRED